MKRVIAFILALTLALSMSVFVSAADEVEIPLDAEHLTGRTDYFASADDLTFGDGTVNADNVEIIAFALPQNVTIGETVTVHIKGSSDGDFRCWLIGADITNNKGDHATFSNMWKASENGFISGEFEMDITLTAADAEPIGGTQANKVCFKAPAAHGILENLTLTHLSITYPLEEDIKANTEKALQELQIYVEKSEAALAAAQAADGDEAALEAALADAQAAVDSIAASEGASFGYPAVLKLKEEAEQVVKEIGYIISGVDADKILASIQPHIDAANAALETAKNAGSDVEAVLNALIDANAASDAVAVAASKYSYDSVLATSRDLRSIIREIDALYEESKALKAKEDAEAAAAAALAAEKAHKTTVTVTIIASAAAAIIVIAAVILVVLKKKKK